MHVAQSNQFSAGLLITFADRPKQSVSDWCCESLNFDEPDNRGPFTLLGREYVREPLDNWANPMVHRQTFVWGSQSTKTGTIMGGTAWMVYHVGARIFWVMPTQDLVRKFSGTRWTPLVRASPLLAARIPIGADRFDFSTLQQKIGNSIIDFTWAGSPSALSSTPARVVNLDEQDKFPDGSDRESDSTDLAEQRTKSFSNPKITDTSTPTNEDGPCWQSYLRSDQRRRFVPCPGCQKFVVLAFSEEFTIFPKVGNEAFVKWDKEARRPDGTWDLVRVEQSARFACPHCGFHIQDRHKTLIDRQGEWRPIEKRCKSGDDEISPVANHHGYHLPSFYAPSASCNVGKIAVKFLQRKGSIEGVRGIINGDFAEPYTGQERSGRRVEIIVRGENKPTASGVKLITADFQVTAPHLWYVVRIWGDGWSRAIEAGPLMEWDQLREVQKRQAIPNNHVIVDSGDQTMVVYEQCVLSGGLLRRHNRPPLCMGWLPAKGISREGWRNEKTGALSKVRISEQDHTLNGKTITIPLFQLIDHDFKSYLWLLRQNKITGFRWEVDQAVATDEYWRHMDGEYLLRERSKETGRVEERWRTRSRTWPNHILDCEKLQLAAAVFHKIVKDSLAPELTVPAGRKR